MGLTPVNVEQFGGLRLDLDPEEAGWNGAVDLLNIDYDNAGRIRCRDGYTHYTQSAAAARYDSVWGSVSADHIVAARGTDIDAIISDGTVLATRAMGASGACVARFGSTTTALLYVANTGSAAKWDGSSWTAVAAAPKTKLCAVQPNDNRLVFANSTSTAAGGPGGIASSAHHVWFSDAGAPETFGANNYVILNPGDGEQITSLVAWNGMLFAFKYSAFYVFYGNSTDSTGNPVFNYRPVVSGEGCSFISNAAGQGAVAGSDGVYFINRRGVWRTTGGPPQKISGAIDPIFTESTTSLWSRGNLDANTTPKLTWHRGRLFVVVQLGTGGRTVFVWDRATDRWTAWDIQMDSLASIQFSSQLNPPILFFAYASGSNHIGCLGTVPGQYTTDDGASIVSRYRSGFSDVGLPGREKTVRQTELVGQGSPTFAWSRDYGAITSTSSQAVTLGTAPATTRALHRLAQNGELLSWQASATSGAWQLNRVCPMLRLPRQPGDKSA